jgi:putative membrane protein
MLVALGILADTDDHGWGHMEGWGAGSLWLLGVATIVLVGLLGAMSVRAGAGVARLAGGDSRHPEYRGREILGERYARGELSTDEYRERIDELQ